MDLSGIQPLLDWLGDHQPWIAAAIFLIAFLESLAIAGVVIPGVLLLFGTAAIAGNGALALWPTLFSAFAGAVLGDGFSFFLGKSLKQHIKNLWPFRRYPAWIANGERYFARHGGKSVVIGRFVGPIRPVIPLVAGMLDMKTAQFIAINILSALAWAPVYILPGFLFGASLRWGTRFPEGFSALIGYSLALIVATLVAIKLASRFLSPHSRLYKTLGLWVERQHNARLFWRWFSDRRQGHEHFPLAALALFTGCFLALLIVAPLSLGPVFSAIDARLEIFFTSIRHPWLDLAFERIALLFGRASMLCYAAGIAVWMAVRRHWAAATQVVLAFLILELAILVLPESLSLNQSVAFTALFASLAAAFIAQEVSHHQAGWIAGLSLAPPLTLALALLYLDAVDFSAACTSALLGFALCGLARFGFNRFNDRAIKPDIFLVALLLLSLLAALLS